MAGDDHEHPDLVERQSTGSKSSFPHHCYPTVSQMIEMESGTFNRVMTGMKTYSLICQLRETLSQLSQAKSNPFLFNRISDEIYSTEQKFC